MRDDRPNKTTRRPLATRAVYLEIIVTARRGLPSSWMFLRRWTRRKSSQWRKAAATSLFCQSHRPKQAQRGRSPRMLRRWRSILRLAPCRSRQTPLSDRRLQEQSTRTTDSMMPQDSPSGNPIRAPCPSGSTAVPGADRCGFLRYHAPAMRALVGFGLWAPLFVRLSPAHHLSHVASSRIKWLS